MIGKTLLGQYQIKELIHQGTQSTIYKALDKERGGDVAIKLFVVDSSIDEATIEKFKQEITVLKDLKHPNIIRVFEDFHDDGQLGFVMEYVKGESLRTRLEYEGVLGLDIAIRIIQQIGAALHYAHHLGIIHRNVEPENILIGHGNTARLTGFSRARLAHASTFITTTTPIEIDKPQYLAPEQYYGEPANEQTDLYCLGLVFYRMLVGKVPIAINANGSQIHKFETIFDHELELVETPDSGKHIHINVRRVLLKSLRTHPKKRYKSIEEFLEKLKGATPQGSSASQPKTGDPAEIFLEGGEHWRRYFGDFLQAFGIGVLTNTIAFVIGNFSLTGFAVTGSIIALAIGLIMRITGFRSLWAWLVGVGIGTSVAVLSTMVFSTHTTFSDANETIASQESVVVSPTVSPEKTDQAVAISTSFPVYTPSPTELPTIELSAISEDTLPDVSSTEMILTEVGMIDTKNCIECDVTLELTVIDDNFLPLRDVAVYLEMGSNTVFGPQYTNTKGRIENLHLGAHDSMELRLSHIVVDQETPRERSILGDGTIISTAPGDVVHATLKLEKLPLEDVFLTQVGKVEVDYECINTSNMIRFYLTVVNENLQPLPGVLIHFYQRGDPLNPYSAKVFGNTDLDGRTTPFYSTQYPPEFWLSHIIINPESQDERTIPGDGTVITANRCDVVYVTFKLAKRPAK